MGAARSRGETGERRGGSPRRGGSRAGGPGRGHRGAGGNGGGREKERGWCLAWTSAGGGGLAWRSGMPSFESFSARSGRLDQASTSANLRRNDSSSASSADF